VGSWTGQDLQAHVAVEQPKNGPQENGLPINLKNGGLQLNMRIHVPDLEKMKTW